jgi:hypothetical protein
MQILSSNREAFSAYMIQLYMEHRFDRGDDVRVPEDRIRCFIQPLRAKLRRRVGKVIDFAPNDFTLVEFPDDERGKGFKKEIPKNNLERVRG